MGSRAGRPERVRAGDEWLLRAGSVLARASDLPLMDPQLYEPPVGIALIGVAGDDAGRIVRANRALATLLASTVEELAGSVLCDFIHEDDRDRALAQFTRMVARARGSCEGEGRLLVKEGGVRWVRVHAGLLPTDGDVRPTVMLHINQIAELTEPIDAPAPCP